MKHLNRTDEQLLAAFARGERTALAELAGRYETRLLGLAAGLLGWRRDLACDAVQEAWVRVIRFADKFDGRSSFKTWAYRIVVNQCRNIQSARLPAWAEDVPDKPADETSNPGHSAEVNETSQTLREAVQALPADKQTVLLLCYHEGMTHEQAAEILEIPLGTVKSRLHAALQDLRGRMDAGQSPLQ
jgi:RNA polymerase sigma-70 factor (ECF subfamily)